MKGPGTIGFILVSVAASITPAAANWFSNPYLGINRNIGSAPNPTPEQLRQERLAEHELFAYGGARTAQNPYSSPTSQTGK